MAAPPPPAQQSEALPPEVIAALMRRGDAMLAVGDISAARLLYERAALAGNAAAATALGRTHDPEALAQLGVRGIRADPDLAASWYRRAVALGDTEAAQRLQRLEARGTR
jgi:TPR repeat protein